LRHVTLLEGEAPRIAFCTDTYPPQVNGVSVVTSIAVRGAQERGWDCAVVAPRYPKPYAETFQGDATHLSGVRMHVKLPSVPFPPYPDIRCAAPLYGRTKRALREFRPHLVHCETEFIIGQMGQRAALSLGIPVVTSYHTDFSRYTESYRVAWMRGPVMRFLTAFHKRSRRVYTPSESSREDLAALGVMNVEVWGRGVDTGQFDPARRSDALRRRLGVHDSFVFLIVSRMAPEKRIDVVLDAFRRLRERRPDLRTSLVVAGGGPELPALERRAGAGVVFMGNLDRQGVLPTLYASADAFAYAADTETLGLVILEAMASGLPVVAAPVAGVGANLRPGENGLGYPVGDPGAMAEAMAWLVTDAALRNSLAAGARAWAEARSWDAELDRMDESYREVIGRAPRPAKTLEEHGRYQAEARERDADGRAVRGRARS